MTVMFRLFPALLRKFPAIINWETSYCKQIEGNDLNFVLEKYIVHVRREDFELNQTVSINELNPPI